MTDPLHLSDMTVHRVVEMETGISPAREFLPNLSAERLDANREWLRPAALDVEDRLILCFQSFVVRNRHHVILVDSCIGNDKVRPARPSWHHKQDGAWMGALAAAGVTIEQVDYVLCTHLHVDHVGWNTRLADGRWVPTFPNARYLFSATELAFWTERNAEAPIPWIVDSVLPIVAANRVELVTSDHAIGDALRLLPTPGHTIDHFAVQLGRGRDGAVITGDLLHSPLQARHPDLHMRLDHDPAQAVATRRAFLERYCDTETICCFSHFPSPSNGRVKRWGEGFRCEYVDAGPS
jgi:glyoxylase-like metal-dependent hydrolase (beta-lactamase superfamily II)